MYKKLLVPYIFQEGTQAVYETIAYQVWKTLLVATELNASYCKRLMRKRWTSPGFLIDFFQKQSASFHLWLP